MAWHRQEQTLVVAADGRVIAELRDATPTERRMILAAPDLLNAMDAMCEYVNDFGESTEAPDDSDCWTVLETARTLRKRVVEG